MSCWWQWHFLCPNTYTHIDMPLMYVIASWQMYLKRDDLLLPLTFEMKIRIYRHRDWKKNLHRNPKFQIFTTGNVNAIFIWTVGIIFISVWHFRKTLQMTISHLLCLLKCRMVWEEMYSPLCGLNFLEMSDNLIPIQYLCGAFVMGSQWCVHRLINRKHDPDIYFACQPTDAEWRIFASANWAINCSETNYSQPM